MIMCQNTQPNQRAVQCHQWVFTTTGKACTQRKASADTYRLLLYDRHARLEGYKYCLPLVSKTGLLNIYEKISPYLFLLNCESENKRNVM